jgi:hypothetical protein
MKLFLSEELMLYTNLPKAAVCEKLKHNTQPPALRGNGYRLPADHKKFEGMVTDSTFTINRVINYHNSFLPLISGHMEEKANGTEIALTLRPNTKVTFLMGLWMAGACFAFVTIFIASFTKGGSAIAVLIPLGMIAAGIIMVRMGFATESEKAKEELAELLQAEINSKI